MTEARDYQLSEALRVSLDKRLEDRINILEALIYATEHSMELLELMLDSEDIMLSKASLVERFAMTEIQAQAVVDMRISLFSKKRRRLLLEEYDEVLRTYVMAAAAQVQEGSKWHR